LNGRSSSVAFALLLFLPPAIYFVIDKADEEIIVSSTAGTAEKRQEKTTNKDTTMSDNRDSNYISVGSWMWMMFVTAIPIVGFIMMIIWACTGENESRKNYFRAIFAWVLVFVVLVIVLALVGSLPGILKHFESLNHKA
jgi:hypothetical protein